MEIFISATVICPTMQAMLEGQLPAAMEPIDRILAFLSQFVSSAGAGEEPLSQNVPAIPAARPETAGPAVATCARGRALTMR